MTTDDMTLAVCNLVRAVMGMGEGTVRPADQVAPAGGRGVEFASVKIINADDVGHVGRTVEADVNPDDSIEVLQVPVRFVASVQFYRGGDPDPAGGSKWSTRAFDRARELGQRLQLSSSIERMATMNLCLTEVGGARNLAELVEANWESRGQVDVTFNVISRITAPIDTIVEVPLTLEMQDSGDDIETRTSEVTT